MPDILEAPFPASRLYLSIFHSHDLGNVDSIEDTSIFSSAIKKWDSLGLIPYNDKTRCWKEAYQEYLQAKANVDTLFKNGEDYYESDEEISRALGLDITLKEVYGEHFGSDDLKLLLDDTRNGYLLSDYLDVKRNSKNKMRKSFVPVIEYVCSDPVVNSEELIENARADGGYFYNILAYPHLYIKDLCYDEMVFMNYQQNIVEYQNEHEKELISEYYTNNGDVSVAWVTDAISRAGSWWT